MDKDIIIRNQAAHISELEQTLSMEKDAIIQSQAVRITELEQTLNIVRRQLEQFQGRQMDELAERRREALKYYREEYEKLHGGYTNVHYKGGDDTVDCSKHHCS